MIDETRRLVQSESLRALLAHYVAAGEREPRAWQHRRSDLEGADPKSLATLHGLLLAQQWIEMKLDPPREEPAHLLPRMYRSTPSGIKALQRALAPVVQDDSAEFSAAAA